MTEIKNELTWRELLYFPLGNRLPKPRSQGFTMVIDKGLGLGETKDLLHISSDYIDFIKLGFGTSALYSTDILREKIRLVTSYGIDIYPGGTFMEVAVTQNKLPQYLSMSKNLGFTAIEVSDGTITMSNEVRESAIIMAADMGFKVLTEVGKKDDADNTPLHEIIKLINKDFKDGAYRVILEGRESGKNVGLYDEQGNIITDELEDLLRAIEDPQLLIWEAPQKEQQQEFIIKFGPNVNLGNIPPHEVLAVEALRVGLRADTFRVTLNKQ